MSEERNPNAPELERPSGLEYNSAREDMVLPEYGRNIHNLVRYVKTIEDREKRTGLCYTLIEMMKQLNPAIRESDKQQRVWDHLHVMADFELNIDPPFPAPDRETVFAPPQRMGYGQKQVRFRHYGRNVEKLVELALGMEDEEEQRAAIVYIGNLMKTFHMNWVKDNNVEDVTIAAHLKEISKGEIDLVEEVKQRGKPLFVALATEGAGTQHVEGSGKSNKGNNKNRRKRNKQRGRKGGN